MGTPPEDQTQPDISTPYDIALLALACLRHPETLTHTGTELIYLREGKTMLATRNALAKRVDGYAGAMGSKRAITSAEVSHWRLRQNETGGESFRWCWGVPIKIREMRFPEDSSIGALRCWKPVAKLDVLFGWA